MYVLVCASVCSGIRESYLSFLPVPRLCCPATACLPDEAILAGPTCLLMTYTQCSLSELFYHIQSYTLFKSPL